MKVTFLSILVALGSALLGRAETIVALTSGNRLLFFDSNFPVTITKSITVTTVGNEALVAIDFRPATGDLYAMAISGRLYLLNLTTNAAAIPPATPTPLVGTSFGFDFNPTVDLIRVTSDGDQNIRLNPNSGSLIATDTTLAYAASDVHVAGNPNIVGSAYTNNFAGAISTILYDIDSTFDTLVYQDPANSGQLHTVGNLGVDTNATVGFDISQTTGFAYALLTQGTGALYTINLASGAATLIDTIGAPQTLNGELVLDIAVPTATRLVNISTRGRVGLGDDVLIGGFFTRGGGRVLVRAIGPTLSSFGVASPLPDPVLTLKDSNGITLATNDDWQSNQAADISATGLAPTNSLESAILTSLPTGNYTGIVSGKGSATGLALVEVFQLP
jgi:hypothetical protein